MTASATSPDAAPGAATPSTPPPASLPPPPDDGDGKGDTADRVLHREEVERTRVFFRVIFGVALSVAVCLPILSGPAWLRVVAACVLTVVATVCVVVLVALRREERYTPALATAVGAFCAAAGVGVIYYIGIFSAASMVLALGIYFFGLTRSPRPAWATYLVVATLYLFGSALLAAGILPDLALFSIAGVAPLTRWFQVVMSQVLFGVIFYLARSSRRATDRAIDEMHRMSLEVRRREAQLAEARVELDRALRPGEGRNSGQLIGGCRLGTLLGRGGMGEVYRADHLATGRAVAVKLLHDNLAENAEHVRRFLREAQAIAAVHTRHVPEVYEVGQSASGTPFMIMELLEGHDLGWHLRHAERLELDNVIDLCDQVAAALAAVRDAGVVHRDLKPGNLFLTDSIPRTWKVLDFGLSKILWSQSSLTRDQALGTPSYMAPEQIKGREIDHLADLYALTAIAYRALTGRPPFAGDEIAKILLEVLYAQPPQPAEMVRLPVDVELVLAVGLAKRPKDRFACVEDMAHALRQAAAGHLDDTVRSHGWALLRAFPWGSRRRPTRRA